MSDVHSIDKISFQNTEIAFSSRSNFELLKMNFLFFSMNNKSINKLLTNILLQSIRLKLPIKPIVKASIFGHFCGGENLDDCHKSIKLLQKYQIGTILDYSVEGEKSEFGFDLVMAETIQTIRLAGKSKSIPFAVFKTTGIASVDLLEKAQKGVLQNIDEVADMNRAKARFSNICKETSVNNVRLFIDAEESWIQGIIDQWSYEEMSLYNKDKALIYNTYQLYRTNVLDLLISAHQKAKKEGYILGAKLVRGAYMEKEAAYYSKNGAPNPIQASKEKTDYDFDQAILYCLQHLDGIHFCAGSHNETSNLLLASKMDELGIPRNDERIWFAQLLGMGDNISFSLAKNGFKVAKYVPYGPVAAVIPYLVRRASENSSVVGQTSRELNLIQTESKRRLLLPLCKLGLI